MLPEHVLLTIDNGATWHEIATALAASPEQPELRYSPDSPVADSRWPYYWQTRPPLHLNPYPALHIGSYADRR